MLILSPGIVFSRFLCRVGGSPGLEQFDTASPHATGGPSCLRQIPGRYPWAPEGARPASDETTLGSLSHGGGTEDRYEHCDIHASGLQSGALHSQGR